MAESVDCVVIGAGVVGLAVARALALGGREAIVLEAAGGIGTGASSRNSEVIHAGIYYAKDSLKARLCVRGRDLLYAYCRSHGVGHSRLGKLIVATEDEQVPALRAIEAHARANGVADIAWLGDKEARRLEPALHAVAALHSPATGIVDSHAFMLALQGDAEAAGATFAFRSPLRAGRLRPDGRIELQVGGDAPLALIATHVVNSAGLQAQAVARGIAGLTAASIPTGAMAKGSYFSLAGRAPFSRLIYPLPGFTGLGVHLTLDLAGKARFGPDAEMVTVEDYAVDPARGLGFYQAVRRYWPDLPDDSLQPDYSGIRPVLHGTGGPKVDFVIQGPGEHGAKGLINLYGIESPGLTASLAIAERVAAMDDEVENH